jgi:hypothetical protein
MESVIKWYTGKPKENGIYIVTYKFGYYPTERPLDKLYNTSIGTSYWDDFWHQYDDEMSDCKVVAWCPLSEIKPFESYKE